MKMAGCTFGCYEYSMVSAGIALMMGAVGSSETSVNICQTTRCNILGDSHLQKGGLIYVNIPKYVDHPLHYFKI
jgi:hypothetical protein